MAACVLSTLGDHSAASWDIAIDASANKRCRRAMCWYAGRWRIERGMMNASMLAMGTGRGRRRGSTLADALAVGVGARMSVVSQMSSTPRRALRHCGQIRRLINSRRRLAARGRGERERSSIPAHPCRIPTTTVPRPGCNRAYSRLYSTTCCAVRTCRQRSLSNAYRSYANRLTGSERVSYASRIAMKRLSTSGPALGPVRSGW